MGAIFSKLTITDTEKLKAEVSNLILALGPFNNSVLELNEWLLNNQGLLILSKEYLNNAVSTKKVLASLESHLSKAHNNQKNILQALQCYREEDQSTHSLTRSLMKEYNEAGYPFAGLSVRDFSMMSENLQSTVKHLNSKVDEIKSKLSSTNKWNKVWKVMHNAVFISILALSVILASRSAPQWATVAATAGSTAIKTTEPWIDSIWAGRLDALRNEKKVVLMIKGNYMCRVGELGSIRATVDRLDIRIESVLKIALEMAMNDIELGSIRDMVDGSVSYNAGVALANPKEMAMNYIELKVRGIGKWVDEVEIKVNACNAEIGKAIAEFLTVIISD